MTSNPENASDTNWQPLINTPNYPDYTSGANTSPAPQPSPRLFFGTDEMTFSATPQTLRPSSRRHV